VLFSVRLHIRFNPRSLGSCQFLTVSDKLLVVCNIMSDKNALKLAYSNVEFQRNPEPHLKGRGGMGVGEGRREGGRVLGGRKLIGRGNPDPQCQIHSTAPNSS